MAAAWVLIFLATFVCVTNGKTKEEPSVVESHEYRTPCQEMDVIRWSSGFHDCFFDRKTKDGGEQLEFIVDRILQHAETCMETSTRPCLPSYDGFKAIMNKTISQIQDYSEMYMSGIYKGKENYKDVNCVEKILRLETYTKCFKTLLQSPSVSQKSFEWSAKEGISCTDKANQGCSNEAKSYLNRIVGKLLGISYKELTTTTTPAPTPEESKPWYMYIAQPFITAWNAIRNFFGF